MKKVINCFSPKGSPNRNRTGNSPRSSQSPPTPVSSSAPASPSASTSATTLARINELTAEAETLNLNLGPLPIQKFPFVQLHFATDGFSAENCVAKGGFGRVYRGNLAPQNQEVAIKCLDPKSQQGTREFVTEVEFLSNADHENIVRLIGYCAENEHRMIVYEYIRMGSLEAHLLTRNPDLNLAVLDWNTRVRIAYETAKGLQYLHSNMQPRRIYRDLKCANILLGEGYTVKLSDFGCAKKAPANERERNLTRVLGTVGYLDPAYFTTGNCTVQNDIHSFGVVLLELVTGRKCIDERRPTEEQSLLIWAKRVFGNRDRYEEIVDPLLNGNFNERSLHALVRMAEYCVNSDSMKKPKMSHIVDILGQLNRAADEPNIP
ncbi:probable serine/threonine-protein kinase PBL5 [Vicia villosa]|uniref:probable serine/threonine-protein kinase PBL5 n=1 Tax=Vicia villosa TaxID=3911 RepID=UPI00273AFF90|nr:probable serine/threonine-protein kinase PBL5 [Vicia villosa]